MAGLGSTMTKGCVGRLAGVLVGFALALVVRAPLVRAEEAPPGATTCIGCHSPSRMNPAIPALRGRDADEITQAMRGFRDGSRPATLMGRLARGFSEDESRAIAEWVVR